MAKKKLPHTDPENNEMTIDKAVKALAEHPAGVFFFTHLMKECGYGKAAIYQDKTTNKVLKDNMMMVNATQKIWVHLRALIPDDKLFLIEIKSRNERLKVVDNTKGRFEQWEKLEAAKVATPATKPQWAPPPTP